MKELDVKFLDTYKRFEKILSDMYSCQHGVSEYISIMEEKERSCYSVCMRVDCWKSDYKSLKHLRWLRNQITHSVDCIDGFCEYNDLVILNDFYDRILHQKDALSILAKYQKAYLQNQNKSGKNNYHIPNANTCDNQNRQNKNDYKSIILFAILLVVFLLLLFVFIWTRNITNTLLIQKFASIFDKLNFMYYLTY